MEIILAKVVAVAAYAAVEYWLGKTDKVKAGSLVEAVILGVKSIGGKRGDD